jgi:hypothetical protein
VPGIVNDLAIHFPPILLTQAEDRVEWRRLGVDGQG